MKTVVFKPDQVAAAAKLIQDGQLVAFPTETVYGLGADATNPTAVKQVYIAKGRPSDNPLIVHVVSAEQVKQYAVDPSGRFKKLTDAFWPGPLTMILPLRPHAFDPVVTGGLKTAAFRNPRKQITLDLIREAGVPIVGPSANTSGKPSPTTAEHVLHDLDGKIAGVLDGGPTDVGVESTVLDLSVTTPVILRPGAITREDIEKVIGPILNNHHHVAADETPKAPGMKYKHYAPNAQVVVTHAADFPAAIKWAQAQNVPFGIMATDDILNAQNVVRFKEQFSLGDSVTSASKHLFDGLRYFDMYPEVKIILAEGFDKEGLGIAYMNRLEKSAGQVHFNAQTNETEQRKQ
ncbi:hypothetical protein IV38_GL000187 [Lactobacillus selangorensis]|uniref:Threonylcarbamoyl-AMP synthase n=1 Tax=Lactobacillus selangorensis TaxID=81857 RepID=A0A0R2FL10_9LACO|nr:L-threonylcarbamoyladenylate synthase [Lactobacillus selangorensis]KRN29305.1 hypothetical protein IV38_GL000187 [Lactobacillus selangorensis]KRN34166.1 hypothetical protein IV40_GL000482 [Lactobacillus selangorensis]